MAGVVVALFAPASAVASTASSDGSGNLTFTAGPGETNWTGLHYDGMWQIYDLMTAPPTAGTNCTLMGDHTQCTGGGTATAHLGDGADRTISSGPEWPSPLDRTIFGEGGDDWVFGTADGGRRHVDGGPGTDQVSMERYVPSQPPQALPGDYTLLGGDGNDLVFGLIYPEFNLAETLDGSAGDDGVNGGAGDDRASGGDGADFVDGGTGRDRLFGNGGDDVVSADEEYLGNPAEVDTIDCGEGDDRVFADAIDIVGLNCERLGFAESVGCGGATCEMTLGIYPAAGAKDAAASAGKRKKKIELLGRARFKLKRGGSVSPAVRLAERGRKLVIKRGGLRVKLILQNKVTGRKGKTKTSRKASFINLAL